MRSLIVMAMFLASFAHAAWKDYSEVRDLKISANGLDSIEIEAGAGSMDIRGVDGLDSIVVKATIIVPDADDDDAMKLIEKKMTLTLDRRGERAVLESDFDHSLFGKGSSARIDLELSLPAGLAVTIDDGSGSINVVGTKGDVRVEDGSGSIDIQDVANLVIDDGSGSIDISTAAGDVSIVDGSGSISVRAVEGSVTIDDGSGGINVNDVAEDLTIVDDGSGGLSFSNVRGNVEQDT